MPELKLSIERDDEILMPAELASSTLSLAEIGAIYFFACMQQGLVPSDHPRFNDPDVLPALQSLKEANIFQISTTPNGRIHIRIDLDNLKFRTPAS